MSKLKNDGDVAQSMVFHKERHKKKAEADAEELGSGTTEALGSKGFEHLSSLLDHPPSAHASPSIRSTLLSAPYPVLSRQQALDPLETLYPLLLRLEAIVAYEGLGSLCVQSERRDSPCHILIHNGRLCIGIERNGSPYVTQAFRQREPELLERLENHYSTLKAEGNELIDVCCALPAFLVQSESERTFLLEQLLRLLETGEHHASRRGITAQIEPLARPLPPGTLTLAPVEFLQRSLEVHMATAQELEECTAVLDEVRSLVQFGWVWALTRASTPIYTYSPISGTHALKGLASSYRHILDQRQWFTPDRHAKTEAWQCLSLLHNAQERSTWIMLAAAHFQLVMACDPARVAHVLELLYNSSLYRPLQQTA